MSASSLPVGFAYSIPPDEINSDMLSEGFWYMISSSSIKSRITSRGVMCESAPIRPNSVLINMIRSSCVTRCSYPKSCAWISARFSVYTSISS